jgi:hypothetical protein
MNLYSVECKDDYESRIWMDVEVVVVDGCLLGCSAV